MVKEDVEEEMKINVWFMIVTLWVVWVFDFIGNTGGALGIVIGFNLLFLCEQISAWSENWGRKR